MWNVSVVVNTMGSALLTADQQKQLDEWIGEHKDWRLIYKASRDGFRASDFHRMSDGKGENLGVIKSSNGFLFGWWTPLGWKSAYDWATDASTFIFTLTNPAGIPAKYKNIQPELALNYNTGQGPILGNGDRCLR